MGVPVAPATVDSDESQGSERLPVHLECDGLGRRQTGEGVGVIPSEPVEHHDKRQWVSRPVAGWVANRVTDRPVAGLLIEATRNRRAQRCELKWRVGERTRSVHAVEILLSGQDTVIHKFQSADTGDRDDGNPTQTETEESTTGESPTGRLVR